MPRALPARDGRSARGELPLDAAGARVREPARAEARRRGEDAARDASPTGPSPCARSRADVEAAFLVERIRGCSGVRARGDGDPLPHERALGRLRGGAARGGHPVPGRVVPLAATARRAAEGAARRDRSPATCGGSRSSAAGSSDPPDKLGEREVTRQNDLARLVRSPRSSRATVAEFVADARGALRRDGRARRPPADAATARRGSSSKPSSCRGSRSASCRRGSRRRRGRSTRSGACSTSASRARSGT